MKTLFICYPKCSTCQKAKKFLLANEVEFEERDIKTETPSAKELKEYHLKSGLSLKQLFNTSGNSYRELGLKDTFDSLTPEEAYELLSKDGMLIKRPILVRGDKVNFGFKEEKWTL